MLNEEEVVKRLKATVDAVRRAAGPTEFFRVERVHRRRLVVRRATGVIAAAAVSVGAILGAAGVTSRDHAGRGTTPVGPAATESRAAFHPQAVRVEPEGTGIVVGSACAGARCYFAGLWSADGGHTWAPSRVPTSPSAQAPQQLLGATVDDWWAAVPDLFATHDGGHSWTRIDAGGVIVAASAAPTGLWVVRQRCLGPRDCSSTVLSQPAAGGPLQPLAHQPPTDGASVAQIIRPDANTAYLMFTDPHRRLAVTRDGGATWTTAQPPCAVGDGRGFAQLAADSPTSVWLACYPPPAHGASGGRSGVLYRSSDSAQTWQQRGRISGLSAAQPSLIPLGASVAWIVDAGGRLGFTADGGRTWQSAAPLPGDWDALVSSPSTAQEAAVVAVPLVRQPNTAMVDDPHADYTVFVTYDSGRHWSAASTLPRHQAVATGPPAAIPSTGHQTHSDPCAPLGHVNDERIATVGDARTWGVVARGVRRYPGYGDSDRLALCLVPDGTVIGIFLKDGRRQVLWHQSPADHLMLPS